MVADHKLDIAGCTGGFVVNGGDGNGICSITREGVDAVAGGVGDGGAGGGGGNAEGIDGGRDRFGRGDALVKPGVGRRTEDHDAGDDCDERGDNATHKNLVGERLLLAVGIKLLFQVVYEFQNDLPPFL